MSQEMQLTYMQARMVRKACDKWKMPLQNVNRIFCENKIYDFIESCWDIFHVEGDEEVFSDIEEYLERRGVTL